MIVKFKDIRRDLKFYREQMKVLRMHAKFDRRALRELNHQLSYPVHLAHKPWYKRIWERIKEGEHGG